MQDQNLFPKSILTSLSADKVASVFLTKSCLIHIYIYNKNNPSYPHALLRGMENGATTVGNYLAVPQKAKQRIAI